MATLQDALAAAGLGEGMEALPEPAPARPASPHRPRLAIPDGDEFSLSFIARMIGPDTAAREHRRRALARR